MDCLEDYESNNSVSCIHCRGNVFRKPLPSNDRRNTHTDTQTDGMNL
jgi:hypothetical protein